MRPPLGVINWGNKMEILSFENSAQPARKKKSLGLILGVALVAGVTTLGSTLAASVTVSSGTITFGQGVAAATACDSSLTLTPATTFDNDATLANAKFKLASIAITGLDATACDGKTFVIKAWGDSSDTALTLFGSETAITSVVNATKSSSTATSGATVGGSTNAITYTITTPTLDASTIYKLTIEQQS
jgi:hypothetical protein